MKQAQRQSAILKSAGQLFAERRFDEVLMDEVARRAGVGKGTLYRYFADKEELYFAVVFDGIAQLKEQIRSGVAAAGDALDQLETAVRAVVVFLGSKRFFFRLMGAEDARDGNTRNERRCRWHRERRELLGLLEEVLRRGVDQGLLEVPHINTAAQILLGMVRSTLRFNEDRLAVEQIVAEILRIFLDGTRRGPSAADGQSETG